MVQAWDHAGWSHNRPRSWGKCALLPNFHLIYNVLQVWSLFYFIPLLLSWFWVKVIHDFAFCIYLVIYLLIYLLILKLGNFNFRSGDCNPCSGFHFHDLQL